MKKYKLHFTFMLFVKVKIQMWWILSTKYFQSPMIQSNKFNLVI
jgi:hypothetical protein